ncbi:MAG: alpha-galactosidase, partial [Lachnospiraceae bacterium]|nr:alpha-galactosidase [Lachnospiraceae bacterium]
SYILGIGDEFGHLVHIYYGKSIASTDNLVKMPTVDAKNKVWYFDGTKMEYPTGDIGDFREHCIEIKNEKGQHALECGYVSHKIYKGKPKLEGLPATFSNEEDCTTLEIVMKDAIAGVELTLVYSAFEKLDVITRSLIVKNICDEKIKLTKVMSACLDVENNDFEMLTLHGSWGRERNIQSKRIGYGRQGIYSERGVSGHQDHPFIALIEHGTSQTMGEVYAMNFVYSGNFEAQCELNQHDTVRLVMGINPYQFEWTLNGGEIFTAPEVVMVYSSEGLGKMTRTYHDLYRNHLIRGKYRSVKRPVLINNWEATYFDFNTEKLLSIAKKASELGIEMLVMDDGWFGNRFDDNRALGDWVVNEDKLQGGLKYLVDEVNKLGMKFGIWFEPEMVCPDSDLYRAHPDWALQIPGREPGRSRNQLVLDISRKEVRDYIFESLSKVLKSANVEYVKWDMNRALTDVWSHELEPDRQGELYHRYMLGVYELQDRLVTEFPDILLENCSSGGGRYDPGMLYYSPQVWCSDNADAIARLNIQEGTSLIYPLSTMGAHVTDCPNHAVGRTTPFDTRGVVALAGTFGYELDVTKISDEERSKIPGQIEMFHKYNDIVREGDYYRIASFSQNNRYDSYMVVSKDKKEALVTFIQVLAIASHAMPVLKLQGLDACTDYYIEEKDEVMAGDALMNMGFVPDNVHGDFKAGLYHLVAR